MFKVGLQEVEEGHGSDDFLSLFIREEKNGKRMNAADPKVRLPSAAL